MSRTDMQLHPHIIVICNYISILSTENADISEENKIVTFISMTAYTPKQY